MLIQPKAFSGKSLVPCVTFTGMRYQTVRRDTQCRALYTATKQLSALSSGEAMHELSCLVSIGVACSSIAPSTRPTVCVMN